MAMIIVRIWEHSSDHALYIPDHIKPLQLCKGSGVFIITLD